MTAPPDHTTTDLHAVIAALRAERDAGLAREATLAEALAQRNSEYGERIDHQAATIDVLKVMSASPDDPQPVFDLIVERARDLCDGYGATVYEFDGTLIHYRAATGVSDDPIVRAAIKSMFPMLPTREWAAGRAILDRQIIRINDIQSEPGLNSTIQRGTAKSTLLIPLMRGNTVLGALALGSRERGGFSDNQAELLKTFAEQAVIAITSAETYRALQTRTSDLQEALEYQTATSDVLNVISRTTFDLQPVLTMVSETAARLCVADQAAVCRFEDGNIQLVTNYGFPPEYAAYWDELGPVALGKPMVTALSRAIHERHSVHIHDAAAIPGYPDQAKRLGKQRTSLGVPLLRAGQPIGVILLARQRVEPFTDRQIELVSTFADQAVIAIENSRLITEQQEALEQQTATADVLQVINTSPGNLAPVFDAMLEKAVRLSESSFGILATYDGECFHNVATRGTPPALTDFLREPIRPAPGTSVHRVVCGEDVVPVADIMDDDAYRRGVPGRMALADLGGARTQLTVALRKDDTLLGLVNIYRQEVLPFTDKQVALLQNFAAQAVIAMENARLISEQREALEQQTATAEVLQVINASPGNLTPVFDAILEKAHSLCGATKGAFITSDGERFPVAATRGLSEAYTAVLQNYSSRQAKAGYAVDELSPREQLRNGADLVHLTGPAIAVGPIGRAVVEIEKIRTVLFVPLRRDGTLLGYITAYREEESLFSEKQIAVLKNFAAQAVIAMENARLINEQREALEQQTATAEVLQVINANPGDLTPVFDAILDKAHTLAGAVIGSLVLFDGTYFRAVATHGWPASIAALFREPTGANRARQSLVDGERFVQVPDIRAIGHEPNSAWGDALAESTDARTMLLVPLRKDGALLGFISAFRPEVRAFSEKEIALLENFAAQAVIAMENARLLTEQQEALERQTATAEVLQVINVSPGNLAPVFDAMLEKAMRLCGAAFGSLYTYDGESFHSAAQRGVPAAYAAYRASNPPTLRWGGILVHMVETKRPVHTLDTMAGEGYRAGRPDARALADLGGARTNLIVPLLKEETFLGYISIYRREVRAFSDKQIALLENFAAQAVIAMENARLITETREALEQQTATAEVLQVINASPGDLQPVFDAILEKAHSLCGAAIGSLMLYDGTVFRAVATRGYPGRYAALVREPFPPGVGHQGLIRGDRLFHVPDMRAVASAPGVEARLRLFTGLGLRTGLSVPLRKDGVLLGIISAARLEVRPFSEKEIALLENFAAQAVIAMENARLITETREALEQQTATAEVLQVINSSPGDLVPVFDAILEKAHSLCGVTQGGLVLREGETFRAVALHSYSGEFAKQLRQGYRGADNPISRSLMDGDRFLHIPDLTQIDHPMVRASVENAGVRTGLYMPLRKDDILLGFISSCRKEIRPFTDKEIALLENFAGQAVIAMENARLLTEQQEALEQQTATADVLGVINASPGDLAPVFDAMLEKAMRLCGAAYGVLRSFDGKRIRILASRGVPSAYAEYLVRNDARTPDTGTALIRALQTRQPTQALDAKESVGYKSGGGRAIADLGGARTILHVPLVKDQVSVGLFTFYRQEVRGFSEKQIALLENFAAQAVIAIENTRLLTEQREALEQQTATADVLQVINASPGNLAPVFDAMLDKAMRLCDATHGHFRTYDGEGFSLAAVCGDPSLVELHRQRYRYFVPGPHNPISRFQRGERLIHISDAAASEAYRDDQGWRELVDTGCRSVLAVALRKDTVLLGYISVYRQEVRAFSDKQIALLENFAAQAVIAMENARLLDEIRQRQAELRTTFDNMGDGVAMFDADLRLAAWNRNFQQIIDLPDASLRERPRYADYMRLLAERGEFGVTGIEAELRQRIEDTDKELRLERVRPDGRVIEVRRNAVPGGGFVLIYSDITERKRSEEEIRAARDAAETALRELRTAQANLIQAEKMASLGQLTAGIAHEIKNPLNFVNNFAALSVDLLGELKDAIAPAAPALTEKQRAEVEEVSVMLTTNLEKITEHGKRADGIVKAMLEHSRGSSGERRLVDLNALIDEALNLAYHGARAQDQSFNVTLERDFGEGITPIEVNPQDITRVFLNIFANGFYAANKRARSGEDSAFMPTLNVTTRDAGEAVEIRVRDNGTGIPADIRDKLFQPFFTTKPTGEGTGLGLSITYDIVTQQHGGSITVDSKVGEYSEFVIRLPRNP